MIYSVALPGLGQYYNRQSWKIPVIYGGIGVTGYFAINNYSSMIKFKTEYLNRINQNISALDPNYAKYTDNNIYSLYTSYKKNFELSIIVGCSIYLLNIIDAYVYGHLFQFDINEDISMVIKPSLLASPYNRTLLPDPVISIGFKF